MIISEEDYDNNYPYLQQKYGSYSEYLKIIKANDAYQRAEQYTQFFSNKIKGIQSVNFVIYPDPDIHCGNLIKILTKVKVIRTTYQVHILIAITPHKYSADCGAYQKKLKDEEFESLYCRCRIQDIMTEQYAKELNDSILNEHWIRRRI